MEHSGPVSYTHLFPLYMACCIFCWRIPYTSRSTTASGNVTRRHGEERGSNGRHIGQHKGDAQHPGGIVSQLRDGRRDEADDNKGHTEGHQLSHDVVERHHDVHKPLARHQEMCIRDSKLLSLYDTL